MLRVERLPDLVARLHAHPRRRLTLLVGIDGRPDPERERLAAALGGLDRDLELISLGWTSETAEEGWRRIRSQLLLPLSRDQPGLLGDRAIPVGGVVVVEGGRACVRQLAGFYDFRIWVGPAATGPDPEVEPHLWVDGTASVPHDAAVEYVRVRP